MIFGVAACIRRGANSQGVGAPTDPQIVWIVEGDRLKGRNFERAYIDNEVAYHKAVINATKTVPVQSAQNPELKSALEGGRATVRRSPAPRLIIQ